MEAIPYASALPSNDTSHTTAPTSGLKSQNTPNNLCLGLGDSTDSTEKKKKKKHAILILFKFAFRKKLQIFFHATVTPWNSNDENKNDMMTVFFFESENDSEEEVMIAAKSSAKIIRILLFS